MMRIYAIFISLGIITLTGCPSGGEGNAMNEHKDRSPASQPAGQNHESNVETATFAAGCFWGVEAAFRNVEGVVETTVGYTGGHVENPLYEVVCTGRTGHAEAVQVRFDPSRGSYEQLLELFWNLHDPTTPNRQGPDVGTQYRSAILFHSPEQEAAAKASKERLEESGRYKGPVVTQIVPAGDFYPAEDYHQQYLEKRGLASCHINLKSDR